MTNKCYYCGNQATSTEHIPAKSLLNGHSYLNLLTVPSCDKHNKDKSELDKIIGFILIKPTISGYKLFTPNPKKTALRNLVTEINIKNIYKNNLFYSDNFKYLNGEVEVTSQKQLNQVLDYFEYMLVGCYYKYKDFKQQLPKTHFCVSLSIYHFLDYPPNLNSRPQDIKDYNTLNALILNSRQVKINKQNIKFEYEIREITCRGGINITVDDGRSIFIDYNDILIIATLHNNIVVFGIFSTRERKFESLNIVNVIERYRPQIIMPPSYKK